MINRRPDLLQRRYLIPVALLGGLLVLLSGWRSFLHSRQLLVQSQEQSYQELMRVLPRGLLQHLVVDDYIGLEQDLEGVMVDPSIASLLVVDPQGQVLAHLARQRPGGPPQLRYAPDRLQPNGSAASEARLTPGAGAPGDRPVVRWQALEAGGSRLGWLRLSHWSTNTLAVVAILARQYLQLMALTLVVFTVLLVASVLVVQREGRRREARLEQQGLELLESSLRDPLTGLANRRGLELLLARAIAAFEGCREGRNRADLLVICLIDLDAFKPVNDRYGHAVGDQLLVEVGRRLCQCLRTLAPELDPPQQAEPRTGRLALAGERGVDQVARLGGDEVVCILGGCTSAGQAEGLAERILHSLGQPFAVERHSLTVGASLGIACAAGPRAPSPLALLQVADHAMYKAKAKGKNHFQLELIHCPALLSSPEPQPDQAGGP